MNMNVMEQVITFGTNSDPGEDPGPFITWMKTIWHMMYPMSVTICILLQDKDIVSLTFQTLLLQLLKM